MSSTSKTTEGEPPAKVRKLEGGEKSLNSSADESKLSAYDTETQKALEEIDVCQNEVDQLNEEASEEILKVEQKYNTKRKPLFQKRADIIQRIPSFWVTAFINHPHISTLLEEVEEEALHYMSSVEVEEFDDIKSGYKIHMHFKTNPYFTNTTLTKEFRLANAGDPVTISTPINWKTTEGSTNQLKELLAQSQKLANGEGSSKRKLKPENKTFFGWFVDNQDPAADETAEVIKDDLWPNPLHYYLVPDIEVEAEDEEEDLDEDEEEDIEEEEEGDEDDEDDADGDQ